MAVRYSGGRLGQHRSRIDWVLTTVCAGLALFVFGFLIGQHSDSVPATLAAVPVLAWFVPVLMTGSLIVPFCRASGLGQSQQEAGGWGATRLAHVPSRSPRLASRRRASAEDGVIPGCAGLALFHQEQAGPSGDRNVVWAAS